MTIAACKMRTSTRMTIYISAMQATVAASMRTAATAPARHCSIRRNRHGCRRKHGRKRNEPHTFHGTTPVSNVTPQRKPAVHPSETIESHSLNCTPVWFRYLKRWEDRYLRGQKPALNTISNRVLAGAGVAEAVIRKYCDQMI
jgi:hypothetical protein